MPESYRMPDGTVLVNVHDVGTCVGRHCVIHNPSAHHMRAWPLVWRDEAKVFERLCVHDFGHPDPDSREYLRWARRPDRHRCDGCCHDPTIEGEVVVREIESGEVTIPVSIPEGGIVSGQHRIEAMMRELHQEDQP